MRGHQGKSNNDTGSDISASYRVQLSFTYGSMLAVGGGDQISVVACLPVVWTTLMKEQ
jgi:hypothetical protein